MTLRERAIAAYEEEKYTEEEYNLEIETEVLVRANALSGEGGWNIVKREYAKRLKEMTVRGQPFSVSGRTERFTHTEEGGVSTRRPAAQKAR